MNPSIKLVPQAFEALSHYKQTQHLPTYGDLIRHAYFIQRNKKCTLFAAQTEAAADAKEIVQGVHPDWKLTKSMALIQSITNLIKKHKQCLKDVSRKRLNNKSVEKLAEFYSIIKKPVQLRAHDDPNLTEEELHEVLTPQQICARKRSERPEKRKTDLPPEPILPPKRVRNPSIVIPMLPDIKQLDPDYIPPAVSSPDSGGAGAGRF